MPNVATTYKPAKGLLRLTWRQIETLDAKINTLCTLAEESQCETRLVMVVNRHGKLRFIESIISEELRAA